MYKEQLQQWLESQGKSYTISGNEIKCQCLNPEHNDNNPSFSINHVSGGAFCFSCGFASHANRILGIKQDADSIRLAKYLSLNKLWEDQASSKEPPTDVYLPPIDFMIEEDVRSIPKEILIELGVYYCSIGRYKGRLIFPIKDTRGNILGFDARIYQHPARPNVVPDDSVVNAKYLRPSTMKTVNVLFPLNYLYNHRKELDLTTIVLTEGLMDALSYIAFGVPAVCNFGLSAPSADKVGLLLSLGAQSIANGFDGDAAGIAGWQKIKDEWRKYIPIERSPELTTRIRESGCKDANEYLEQMRRI